jgi:hypothetical protein
MSDGLAGELERAGRVHELLRLLREAEREAPRPPRAAPRPDDACAPGAPRGTGR